MSTLSSFAKVLTVVPEEDRTMVALSAMRLMHVSPGWRPSDAARAEVRQYQERGREQYAEDFRQERERTQRR